MATLSLTKLYGSGQLLTKSAIDSMWTELEAFTNGGINDDVLNSGWAHYGQVTLPKDSTWTMGATNSASVVLSSSTNDMTWDSGALDVILKVGGTEVARIDSSSNDLLCQKDVYFKDTSTSYSLQRLVGAYQKPVLVYVDSDSIDVENNCETSNQSLIVFPFGPLAVTEDTSSTHKYRRLKLSATANGYGASHTGSADSGLRVGLSLSANTWYFVYAVNVQYGTDAGNGFILVVDDTDPAYSNEGTLDGRYGSGQWVYLGTIRRGFGTSATTTLVPFIQDAHGWTMFSDRGTANAYHGIQAVSNTLVTASSTPATVFTFSVGNSGNSLPTHVASVRVEMVTQDDGDGDWQCIPSYYLADGTKFLNLQNNGGNSPTATDGAISVRLPVISSASLRALRMNDSSLMDFYSDVYISAFLDHLV